MGENILHTNNQINNLITSSGKNAETSPLLFKISRTTEEEMPVYCCSVSRKTVSTVNLLPSLRMVIKTTKSDIYVNFAERVL